MIAKLLLRIYIRPVTDSHQTALKEMQCYRLLQAMGYLEFLEASSQSEFFEVAS